MKYLCLILSSFLYFTLKGQNLSNIHCAKDSVEQEKIISMLRAKRNPSYYDMYLKLMNGKFYWKKEDCFCSLLIYFRIFDTLLSDSLKIEELNKSHTYRLCSYSIDGMSELKEEYEKENQKDIVYLEFYKFYEKYQRDVVRFYKEDNEKLLERDIDYIMQSNLTSHPIILRNILLGVYDKLIKR
jgi:hypothetical protein